MQNTLYLCGLEYDDYEYVGLGESPYIRCMADDACLVVAASRSAARQMLIKEYSLEEYTHPMTIRKVCMTNLAPDVLNDYDDYEAHEDLFKLAWKTVTDLIIPYAGWCQPMFDYRSEDRRPSQRKQENE